MKVIQANYELEDIQNNVVDEITRLKSFIDIKPRCNATDKTKDKEKYFYLMV